jgi:pimeloyl-ACP methyl ester carboxylesterase
MFDARDLRAIAQLASQATHEVTNIVQSVHSAIGQDPFGMTKFVYNRVRDVNQLVGTTLDVIMGKIEHLVSPAQDSPERLAVLAALNGVMGDRLFASNNHLAIPMQMITAANDNTNSDANQSKVPARLLIFVHGLCMNDLQWTTIDEDTQVSYGNTLQRTLGYTPTYLRYNTGRSIAENGLEFSNQLETLVQQWTGPIESISIIGYSMGGLITHIASKLAFEQQLQWSRYLKKMVFIGTPHLGAPLEQIGDWVEQLLGHTSYTAPFARLTQLRSQGINDLRMGLVNHPKSTLTLQVSMYVIAGTTSAQANANTAINAMIGDGLVPIDSALGDLAIPKEQQKIIYQTNHLQLLHSQEVGEQLIEWLS